MEEEKKEEQEKQLDIQIKETIEEKLKKLLETGLQAGNIDYFGKLIDIHKDIENEDYWNVKKEGIKMRYDDYSEGGYSGNYGRRGVPGTGRGRSRGRYRDGRYSARDSRQEEMLENMQEHFEAYSESKEAMNMGNYGAEEDTMRSLDYMLKSTYQFMEMLQQDASSEEEMQLIKKYAKKIAEI